MDQLPLSNIVEGQSYIDFLRKNNLRKEADLAEKELRKTQVLPPAMLGSTTLEKALDAIITCDKHIMQVKEDIRKLSVVDHAVLILGESGTGKELIARALHGDRKGKFIPINTTSLPDYLIESELFGHKKGSFTGADSDKVGLIKEADNGTVFFDEIGDMPIAAQAKLLRVLQDKKLRRVGDNNEIPFTARVVSATNKNIGNMIASGTFRRDLYARLAMFELKTTPLHFRRGDILLLLDSFDPKKTFPRDLQWTKEMLEENVRSIQARVLRWQVLGRMD